MPTAPRAPRVLSQSVAQAWLESRGWTMERGGKHSVKMVKQGCRPITLPMHKGEDYGKQLRGAIVRQAECAQIEEG